MSWEGFDSYLKLPLSVSCPGPQSLKPLGILLSTLGLPEFGPRCQEKEEARTLISILALLVSGFLFFNPQLLP